MGLIKTIFFIWMITGQELDIQYRYGLDIHLFAFVTQTTWAPG